MNRTASKTTNMTAGNPVRVILAFAAPLLIGNVFQQVYSLVDTMIAGHFLADGAIAAIGATGVLYSLLMNLTWGLNNGYCVVLSRLFGGGVREQFRRGAAVMIKLNLGIGALLTVVSVLFLKPAMRLLLTPADVFDQSYLYIVIILGGMLTTVTYNGCAGFLRAMGNSRTPLYFLILSSLLNLALGALFILRYSMQAMGHKVLPVLSSAIKLAVKILSAAVLVPVLGYLGVAVTEPVIWCLCALFLAVFYVTIGCQRQSEGKDA